MKRLTALSRIRLSRMGLSSALTVCLAASMPSTAFAIAKEQKLLRKHDCTKCHSISKKKDGPSIKDIAEKYRDDGEAMGKLYTHMTTETTVEVDGKEETHKPIDIDDREQIESIIRWMLDR